MTVRRTLAATALTLSASLAVGAQSVSNVQYVNGFGVPGSTLDVSAGTAFERRLGMFSDLYYDRGRNEWWGLADRGPGGGTLPYETRVERFSLTVNANTGAISDFQVLQTIKFTSQGVPLNGLAPQSPNLNILGNSFDPEGFVVVPGTGNFLVSDEYGPSLYEFDRNGNKVRTFTTPANLIPRNASNVPNFAGDAGNTAGKTNNRGFEGLAISPDGKFAYAMLQSGMLDEGIGNGLYARIVKFDVATGLAVAQYAYKMESNAAGRGTSALVALGNEKFLVLERNNRGVGVGATFATADKLVFQIDLAGATDISSIGIPNGTLPNGVITVQKSGTIINLATNTIAELGNKPPEKMEGLTVGPQLANGAYMLLVGTDNDFSVTQNAAGTQFDVYFNFGLGDPYANSIQCPIGTLVGCFLTSNNNTAATVTSAFTLLPGSLQSYSANINGYVSTVPEPGTVALVGVGLLLVTVTARKRRNS